MAATQSPTPPPPSGVDVIRKLEQDGLLSIPDAEATA